MSNPPISISLFQVSQLRHLYAQMLHSAVKDQPGAARGLLGPAISHFERVAHDLAHKVEADHGREFDGGASKARVSLLGLDGWEVVWRAGFFWFVNHREQLATIGFATVDTLQRNAAAFLSTPEAMATYKARYVNIYGE
jgi:hypothetical protein